MARAHIDFYPLGRTRRLRPRVVPARGKRAVEQVAYHACIGGGGRPRVGGPACARQGGQRSSPEDRQVEGIRNGLVARSARVQVVPRIVRREEGLDIARIVRRCVLVEDRVTAAAAPSYE